MAQVGVKEGRHHPQRIFARFQWPRIRKAVEKQANRGLGCRVLGFGLQGLGV